MVGSTIWSTHWNARQVGTWDPATNTFTPVFTTPQLAGALAYDPGAGILWVGQLGGMVVPYSLAGAQLGPGFNAIAGLGLPPGTNIDTVDGLTFQGRGPSRSPSRRRSFCSAQACSASGSSADARADAPRLSATVSERRPRGGAAVQLLLNEGSSLPSRWSSRTRFPNDHHQPRSDRSTLFLGQPVARPSPRRLVGPFNPRRPPPAMRVPRPRPRTSPDERPAPTDPPRHGSSRGSRATVR